MDIYEPRLIRNHELVELEGLCFKPYSIAAEGREDIDMEPVFEHAAEILSNSSIPSMDHRGLGYIIYHSGTGGDWLLMRAWLDGGILSGLLGRIDGDRYTEVTAPLIECVWEEIPAHHERGAWVKHIMTAPENPQAYLQDRLVEGYH